MTKESSIRRKRYNNSRRSFFKRRLFKEKNKIKREISDWTNNVHSNISEHSENDESVDENPLLHSELRDWTIKYNVRTYCLRDLLRILNAHGVPFLPKDPSTFLKTPRTTEIENVANGQFWYSGIQNKLLKMFETADKSMEIELIFHVDGLQLFQSSTKQFWPILAQVYGNFKLKWKTSNTNANENLKDELNFKLFRFSTV